MNVRARLVRLVHRVKWGIMQDDGLKRVRTRPGSESRPLHGACPR